MICTDWTRGPDGARYVLDGYSSMIQQDMNDYGTNVEKTINKVLVDFEAAEQTTPNRLLAQMAYGAQPRCVTWKDIGEQELTCLTEQSAAEHAANNTRPNLTARYNTFYRGRYLAVRIWIDTVEGQSEITGGNACLSKMVINARRAQGEWT